MNIFKSGEPIDLSEHMLATYQTLRVVLFVIALSFPFVLWIGGCLYSGHLALEGSMSDYYHGPLRNWFVGVLFAISVMLVAYKGYRPAENVALNIAGACAVLVALFPNRQPGPNYHAFFAVCFFLCIAYVCIFCASATLPLVKEERRAYYRRLYKILGWAMVISPAVALIMTLIFNARSSYIFFAEACGVYAFAAYWLVKTLEIRETNADEKAASGEIQLESGAGASDAVRELQVTYVK
jgi:hypothetical protein